MKIAEATQKSDKIRIVVILLYQVIGVPLLIKYVPVFLSQSGDLLDAYPLFLYGLGWPVIFGVIVAERRRRDRDTLGLASLRRGVGKGFGFPKPKTWLYRDMPVILANTGREGRRYVVEFLNRRGTLVILWLPANLGAGLYLNNLEKEPKVVADRGKILSFSINATWKNLPLPVCDPSFATFRYFALTPVDAVLQSGRVLERLAAAAEFVSRLQGRLIIEDTFIVFFFPHNLPRGEEFFPVAYDLWREVASAPWPQREGASLSRMKNLLELLLAAAIAIGAVAVVGWLMLR